MNLSTRLISHLAGATGKVKQRVTRRFFTSIVLGSLKTPNEYKSGALLVYADHCDERGWSVEAFYLRLLHEQLLDNWRVEYNIAWALPTNSTTRWKNYHLVVVASDWPNVCQTLCNRVWHSPIKTGMKFVASPPENSCRDCLKAWHDHVIPLEKEEDDHD